MMAKLSDLFYPSHFKFFVGVAAALMVLLIAAHVLSERAGMYVVLLAVLIVLATALISLRRIQESIFLNYRQLEALQGINSILAPRQPLPPMRKWAASPDFLCEVVKIVGRTKPNFSIEVGSGVSTVVIGYLLEKNSRGRHIALDHDTEYAEKTRKLLQDHELTDYAEVRHVPLEPVQINGQSYEWYDQKAIPDRQVDLLIIDGPPRAIGKHARYPAIPLLINQLKPGALILVDDTNSTGVSESVNRWEDEFRGLSCQQLDVEKGACLIRINGAARS